ncbi:MAG: hypothetical protein KC417_11795, partial [Myxococcales bacterium]|nr:hypothetical protein [Myxococcales bacterium]
VHEGAVGTTPALLEGNGVPLIRSRAIRRRLFGEMSLLDDPQSERGARYRDAHRHAARYAEFLEARFVARGDFPGLLAELRRFYRMGLGAKLQSAGTD